MSPRRAALLDRLRQSDRGSPAPPARALAAVCADPRLIGDLIAALDDDDAVVRRRAAEIIEKTTRNHTEWLEPHRASLLPRATARSHRQDTLCRLIPVIPRLEPTRNELRNVTADLFDLIDGPGRQVQVCALQALYDLSAGRPRLRRRVREALERKLREGSPAVQARARRLLAEAPPRGKRPRS